jgi:hypothetical protein
MNLSEQAIRFLEEHIPELAEVAFKAAYWKALASGHNVLICENGILMEVHPDGSHTILKKLPPPTSITPGTKVVIS